MIDNYIREVIGGIGARSKKEQLLRGFCSVLEYDWLYQSKWDLILLNSWPSCRYLHRIGPDHRGVLNIRVHYHM